MKWSKEMLPFESSRPDFTALQLESIQVAGWMPAAGCWLLTAVGAGRCLPLTLTAAGR
jgi:hypothetical protein